MSIVQSTIHGIIGRLHSREIVNLNQYVNNAILTANVSNITTNLIDQKLNELVREVRSMKTPGYGRANMLCEDTFEYKVSADKNE